MTDSIYQVITPAGQFQVIFDDEDNPAIYQGDPSVIQHFKNWLLLEQISGFNGARITPDDITPDELYGFCQPNGSGNVILPPLDDLIAFSQEDNEPTLDNIGNPIPMNALARIKQIKAARFDSTNISGMEKVKLAKEISQLRGQIKAAKSGMEKVKMAKRISEIRVILGVKSTNEQVPTTTNSETSSQSPSDEQSQNEIQSEQGEKQMESFIAELDLLQKETDIIKFDVKLDEIAAKIKAAWLMDALDAKLNETADVLTVLMNEAEQKG